MRRATPTTKFSSEHGVYIPILAVTAMGVLLLFSVLTVDTGINMTTRVKAQRFLEIICAPESLPITRAATIETIDRLNHAVRTGSLDFLLKHVEIESFHIIFPTPSSDGSLANNTGRNGPEPIFQGRELSSAPLSMINKSCIGGITCLVGGDVAYDDVFHSYPANFWNNRFNGSLAEEDLRNNDSYGDVFACEMIIQPKKLFKKKDENIKLKVVYEKAQKGALIPGEGEVLPVPPPTARNQLGGGLIIGIATQMSTRADTPSQFHFDTDNDNYNPDPDLLPVDAFSAGRGVDLKMQLLHSHRFADTAGASRPRFERLTACTNPAVLTRNAFLTAIVGMAARDGLRDRTEIVHINPIHLDEPDSDPEFPTYRQQLNPPTILWQGWNDIALTAGAGTTPYVTYKKADGTELDPGVLSQHPLNPGNVQGNPMDRILSGQLRDCLHLYEGRDAGGINRYTDFQLNNSGYEPQAITAVSSAEAFPINYDPLIPGSRWDTDPTTNHNSAEQLVSVLGTTQSCPHGSIGDPSDWPPEYHEQFTVYESGVLVTRSYGELISCNKPAIVQDSDLVPEDLRGDIEGFLAYLIDQYPVQSGPGSITWQNNFDAYDVPGRNQAGLKPRREVFSRGATAVLVTHKRITDNDVERIRHMREQIHPKVALHVVYIPTNRFDASKKVMERFQQAFDTPVANAVQISQATKNQLLVILPSDCPGSICNAPASAWAPWFSGFWNSSVKTDEIGISDTARSFYGNVIKQKKVKL